MPKVTSQDGTPIAYDQNGSGPALVLVAGALSNRNSAMPLLPFLAPHYTVYTYDRRGRGDSGDTKPYTVAKEIQDLQAILAQAGGSAYSYGHSSGAVLALRGAENGLKITKLALFEPPFIVDDSRPVPDETYLARLQALIDSGRNGDAVVLFMTEAVGTPKEQVDYMRQSEWWAPLEKLAPTLLYDQAIMMDDIKGNPVSAANWSAVTMPTLVMDGGASPTWVHNTVQAVVDVLPNAHRVTIPDQVHGVAPEALAPVLIDFFGA